MKTIKKYIKPCITTILIDRIDMLCSSDTSYHICSNACKLWHICQDRDKGKYCPDKTYN